MRQQLLAATAAAGGVISRREALAQFARHVVADAVTDGALARIFPTVYALPDIAADQHIRRQAALLYRRDAALSHLDALAVWGLSARREWETGRAVHLTVAHEAPPARVAGICLHRRNGFDVGRDSRVRGGLRVVRLEQAVVESWPQLPAVDQRGPAIAAVQQRLTTADRLAQTLARQPRTSGARDMARLFALLAAGNQSALEIWGHERIFSDPRLPPSRAQVPARLKDGRRVYLDRVIDEVLINVELDGAAWHGMRHQRERDLRRDAAVAALGYLPVRMSHERLTLEPEAAIADLLAVVEMRRRQFGVRPA